MAKSKVGFALEELMACTTEARIEQVLASINPVESEDVADKVTALELAVERAKSLKNEDDPLHEWLGTALTKYRGMLR